MKAHWSSDSSPRAGAVHLSLSFLICKVKLLLTCSAYFLGWTRKQKGNPEEFRQLVALQPHTWSLWWWLQLSSQWNLNRVTCMERDAAGPFPFNSIPGLHNRLWGPGWISRLCSPGSQLPSRTLPFPGKDNRWQWHCQLAHWDLQGQNCFFQVMLVKKSLDSHEGKLAMANVNVCLPVTASRAAKGSLQGKGSVHYNLGSHFQLPKTFFFFFSNNNYNRYLFKVIHLQPR